MTRKVDVKVERSGNKKRASMTCATGLCRMTSGPRRAKRRPVQIASRLEASKGSKRDQRKNPGMGTGSAGNGRGVNGRANGSECKATKNISFIFLVFSFGQMRKDSTRRRVFIPESYGSQYWEFQQPLSPISFVLTKLAFLGPSQKHAKPRFPNGHNQRWFAEALF